MKLVRNLLDKQGKLFHKGGKLEKLFPLFEAGDTFLFTPGKVTKGPTHVRDGARPEAHDDDGRDRPGRMPLHGACTTPATRLIWRSRKVLCRSRRWQTAPWKPWDWPSTRRTSGPASSTARSTSSPC